VRSPLQYWFQLRVYLSQCPKYLHTFDVLNTSKLALPVDSSPCFRKDTLPFTTSTKHYVNESIVGRVKNGSRECLVEALHQGTGISTGFCKNPSRRRLSALKVWLPKQTRKKMVLGDDLGLEEVTNLSLNALVGRFSYRRHCTNPLYNWVKNHWFPILGYVPVVFYLLWGWLVLPFKTRMTLQRPLRFYGSVTEEVSC